VRDREAQCPPGQHGRARKAKMAGYGVQLREKQKVKRTYGVLESQFRRYFEAADRQKGVTGELLLQMLERRLDNVVYRLGFATSRAQARQLVRHGHFNVNGKKVDIPSYSVRSGDSIAVRVASAQNTTIQHAMEEVKGRGIPSGSISTRPRWPAGFRSCRRASRSTCPCRNSSSSSFTRNNYRSIVPQPWTCGGRTMVTCRSERKFRCCGKVFSGPSGWSSSARR
jgi:ribosomal protein S4